MSLLGSIGIAAVVVTVIFVVALKLWILNLRMMQREVEKVTVKLQVERQLLDLVLSKREEVRKIFAEAEGREVKIQFGVPRVVDLVPGSPLQEGKQ